MSLAVPHPIVGRVRVAGIGLLAVLAASLAPATAAGAAKPELIVSDFGVVATVKLSKPLARAAASSPVGAGLGIGIGHRDSSFSGLALRGSSKVRAKARGGLPNAIAFTVGRRAWFFAEDPKAASIERVAVGGFGLSGKAAGARASFVWSGQDLLDELFGGGSSELRRLLGYPSTVLKIAPPPPFTAAQFCNALERQIRLADEGLRNARSRHGAALKTWIARAGAHFERHCETTSRLGGGGKPGSGQDGDGTPGEGTPGPPANQAPSATHQEYNGFPGKVGVEKSFEAVTADPDGQVVAWSWDWGDGSSTSGTGADPASAHTFAKPKIYQVRLTVTDDEGASTTETIPVPIGAEGSRTIGQGVINIICPDPDNAFAEFKFEVRIPSYAEEPIPDVRPHPEALKGTELCADSGQLITTERMNGNALGEMDEWDTLKDTLTITVSLYWAGPGGGGNPVFPLVTVNWK